MAEAGSCARREAAVELLGRVCRKLGSLEPRKPGAGEAGCSAEDLACDRDLLARIGEALIAKVRDESSVVREATGPH